MQYDFYCNNEIYTVSLEKKGDVFEATVGEKVYSIDACKATDRLLSFIVDGRSVLAHLARGDAGWALGLGGKQYVLEDPVAAEEKSAGPGGSGGGDGHIATPMPGKVVEVLVAEGDSVAVDQPLVILESMKMQNEIKSDVDGVVSRIHLAPGALANFGDPLIEIEAEQD